MYLLYLDGSGSVKNPAERHFVLAGVSIFERRSRSVRRYPVGQRFDAGGVDGEVGVEKVGEPDAVGFGCQSQEGAVSVEGPGTSSAYDFEGIGLVAVDEAVCHGAGGVLPLLHEYAWRHDEAALHVSPDHEFLDEEACHDGLVGARVVGEQEAQRLAREHLAV